MTILRTLAATSFLLGSAHSHMFISSPVPIAGTSPKDPLDPSGSNFPCHGVALPSSGGQSMAAGSSQLLAFELAGGANTAVHGGGSCQISITYETEPAKQKDPSNWKVIYSILGGCPSTTVGNLNSAIACTSENQTDCVNQFNFEIPKGVKSGHAIMAWTWFNNIGNREMYMNCVNTELTGGDGSEMDKLPEMFVANLESVGKCPTTASINVAFPSPGSYATTKTANDVYPLAMPTGQGCSGGAAPSYANTTSAATSYAPAQASSSASHTTLIIISPGTPTPAPTPVASSIPLQAQASTSQQTAASIPLYTSASSPEPSYVPAGNCTGKTVPCPTPGQIICVDSSHFGICDIDFCALPEAVAPGTACSNGMISRRRKRSLKDHHHFHQHAHNR